MAELGVFKKAAQDAAERAQTSVIQDDGMTLHQYPDYQTYVDVQTAGNKAKLGRQFVKQNHIKALSEYLNARGTVDFGLCHGTRQGKEQRWFRKHLTGRPKVLGTEISDTADQFKNTVQWDFHDENPEWADRADFVYSNAWDHAFDPAKAFRAWVKSLKPGGIIFFDHTVGQMPQHANALDPFGITYDAFAEFLTDHLGDVSKISDEIDLSTQNGYKARVVVLERTA